MKGHQILNLFLVLVTIIFITNYLDRFEDIEEFLYYLGWWFIIAWIVMGIVCFLINANKGRDDGNP